MGPDTSSFTVSPVCSNSLHFSVVAATPVVVASDVLEDRQASEGGCLGPPTLGQGANSVELGSAFPAEQLQIQFLKILLQNIPVGFVKVGVMDGTGWAMSW